MATRKFPQNFVWGAATSSYQIEGGWDADGRSPSIWDTFCHQTSSPIADGSSGDYACDSYHQYKEDVRLLKELGVKSYRFSFSWPRLLPNGSTSQVNPAGVQYYRNLITELLANGIQPCATLLHWDHPQILEDKGGWLNEAMVDHFAEYARFCFENFGDLVKQWITINETWVISWHGYGDGSHAPGHCEAPATYPYVVGHHLIKAHAKAYRIYDSEFRASQAGVIGPCIVLTYGEPASNKQEDIDAAERHNAFRLGWFAHPICVDGDYPALMKECVLRKSLAEGRFRSRLPEFTDQEKEMIKGSYDFIGFNYYTSQLVKNVPAWKGRLSYMADQDVFSYQPFCWKRCDLAWLAMAPWGFRKALQYIRDNYGNPEVWITENGCSDSGSLFQDGIRIEYVGKHLSALHDAIFEDKCNVKAYFAWSLMDNFEWAHGYTSKFGLYSVDFKDPKRNRRPKASAKWYARIAQRNELIGDFPHGRSRELCSLM